MSASLDGPAPFFSAPGPDERQPELSELVDGILANVGADRMLAPDEIREIQRLMGGLQAIGSQRMAQQSAAQAQQGMSDETSDFGATEGTEPLPGGGPDQGVSYMQG